MKVTFIFNSVVFIYNSIIFRCIKADVLIFHMLDANVRCGVHMRLQGEVTPSNLLFHKGRSDVFGIDCSLQRDWILRI